MRIYYARPITHYDTPEDVKTVEYLIERGFEVCDPNHPIHTEEYKKQGFDYFFTLIDGCQGLFYKSFNDGAVGAGVAKEIEYANTIGLFIARLDSKYKVLTVDQTRARIKVGWK